LLVPIRCFTCGGLVGDKYEEFANNKDGDESPSNILDDLGLKRYCCRRTILSTVEFIDQMMPYYEALSKTQDSFSL
tara:strand:+ start:603 stop:830 length:228 start_codon:yes stop_codon:yes gene_type:complete